MHGYHQRGATRKFADNTNVYAVNSNLQVLLMKSLNALYSGNKNVFKSLSFLAIMFDVFLNSFNLSNIHFFRQIIRGSRDACLVAPSLPPPMALSFIPGFMPR